MTKLPPVVEEEIKPINGIEKEAQNSNYNVHEEKNIYTKIVQRPSCTKNNS